MTIYSTINVAGTPNPALSSVATRGGNAVASLKTASVKTIYYVTSGGALGSTTTASGVPAGATVIRVA
jgi:hypothetical protein